METSLQISRQSKILQCDETKLLRLEGASANELRAAWDRAKASLCPAGRSLVLTGRSLAAIFAWADCLDFFKTAVQFDSVLCCRVTPKQKVGIFGIPEIGGNRALGAEGEQARDSGHRRWRERRQHAAAERLRRGDPRERGRAGESRGAVRRRLRARATSWCGSFDRWCDCCACTERGTGAGAGRSRGIRCTNRWCCAGARPCTRCSRCSPGPRSSARSISPSTPSSSSFSLLFSFIF